MGKKKAKKKRKKSGNGRRKKAKSPDAAVDAQQVPTPVPFVPIPTPVSAVPAVPIPTPVPVIPAPPPPPAQVAPPSELSMVPKRVSLSAARRWFQVRQKTLLEQSLALFREKTADGKSILPALLTLPDQFIQDIDNVLCSIEHYAHDADKDGTRKLVGSYTRLVEVTLHWTTHCKEQIAKIERALELREAVLDTEVREELRKIGATAVKENAVKAGKASNPSRQKLADLMAEWMTLKFQLQNIITSLRVEIIVQDSCWVQRELGYRDPGLSGASGGPSYQG